MKILSKSQYEFYPYGYIIEFKVEKNGNMIYVNIPLDNYEEKCNIDEASCWIYTESVIELMNNDIYNFENYYYICSEQEFKDLYNLCINS